MIIRRLTMHNFGVYASTNVLEFNGKKSVVLIGGMNGRGKTTILEAVLLSLYGSNSFAYRESRYTTYGQYLKSYVNKADGTLESFVEIEFAMDQSNDEVYRVRRYWDGKTNRVREKISVMKNGEENRFLTENWPMFVENLLPSALSNFFFFDGEKIAEIAVEETSDQMKESIKAMLGINVLDVLQSDIAKIIKKISKNNLENQDLKHLDMLRQTKDDAEIQLQKTDADIEKIKCQLDECQIELEKLNAEYSVKGGGILKQKNFLMKQRSESIAAVNNSQEKLLDMAGGELPLLLVSDLLKDIEVQGKAEQEKKLNNVALEKVNSIYREFQGKSNDVDKFIDFMQSEISTDNIDDLYNLSDYSLYQIEQLNEKKLNQSVSQTKGLIKKRNKNQKKVDEVDNSLSVDIDESSLKDIFEQIKIKEHEVIAKQIEIETLNKERATIHGKLIVAESEFSKYAEKTLFLLETMDTNERTVKYAHMAIEIIKLYRIRLQARKTDILAKTMTECYKRLANKKNLVDHIKMEPDTLDLHYLNSEGDEIAKKRLSAGEKQLMVISLLWALAICSKKKLPVIIDTPLSRLDSAHRRALIKTYFPKASDQTIILSTDSEIDETYYKLMKKSVGDEFTLKYNDKTKNTTIVPGYFGWENTK